MVKDFLNSDDANSTQLTGKKLRDKGIVFTDLDGKLVEIEVDSPSTELEAEQEQEFFVESEYGEEKETEQEREERKRRELQVQKLSEKNQQQKIDVKEKNQGNPNLKLDKIEQGIENSQNDGRAVHESAAVQKEQLNDLQKESLKNSVDASKVPDARGGDGHGKY